VAALDASTLRTCTSCTALAQALHVPWSQERQRCDALSGRQASGSRRAPRQAASSSQLRSASEQARGALSGLALHGQQLRETAPRLRRRRQARPSPPAARARAGVPQAAVRRGQQRRAARHGAGLQACRAPHARAARQRCHGLAKRPALQVLSCTEHQPLPQPCNGFCTATLFAMFFFHSPGQPGVRSRLPFHTRQGFCQGLMGKQLVSFSWLIHGCNSFILPAELVLLRPSVFTAIGRVFVLHSVCNLHCTARHSTAWARASPMLVEQLGLQLYAWTSSPQRCVQESSRPACRRRTAALCAQVVRRASNVWCLACAGPSGTCGPPCQALLVPQFPRLDTSSLAADSLQVRTARLIG
jgi:hypothetical protein